VREQPRLAPGAVRGALAESARSLTAWIAVLRNYAELRCSPGSFAAGLSPFDRSCRTASAPGSFESRFVARYDRCAPGNGANIATHFGRNGAQPRAATAEDLAVSNESRRILKPRSRNCGELRLAFCLRHGRPHDR